MREGILIGRKNGKGKPITDVIPFDEARRKLSDHRNSSSKFKDYDIIELWKPVGVKSVVKDVVEANEKRNGELAEEEAEKPKKTASKATKAAAVIASACLLLGFSANAQNATDITTTLGATTISATSTNTAESAAYHWTADDVLVLQATCTAADAGTSNVLFFIDTSLNGTDWKADQYTATFACNGSNVANTVITRTTNSYGGLFWKVGGVGTDQTNAVTLSGVTYYIKE